ncbi:MAG: hypothetical protein ACK4YQ_10405 [Phenylobacterium sp.]|uniref:hypothetical protein n=1 Tax=Phenylobacterium sp. TaxID=1871053 RepID=UPI00391B6316
MNEFVRLLLLVALAGTALTFLGSAAIWFMDEERRLRRALRRVLKGPPEAVVFARGRGRAAGFQFASGLAAVAWDNGAWCLVYRLEELMGAELIVDGQVVARAFRGEPRRALDQMAGAVEDVRLRLIFDDPRHPDFELELWTPGDQAGRAPLTPAKAVQEANRWLARAEAILRRSAPAAPAAAQVQPARSSPPAAPPLAARQDVDDEDDAPPWDDDLPDRDEAIT